MNEYWPKGWKKALPNFLGEDFFASFEDLEGMNTENSENNNNNMNMNNNSKQSVSNTSSIRVNVYESGHELLCIFRLPGLKLSDVDIEVYDMILEVTGRVFVEETGYRAILQEIYQGSVKRKVQLPYPVRHDKMDASYHHGYLIIRLHRLIRQEEPKTKIVIHDLDK